MDTKHATRTDWVRAVLAEYAGPLTRYAAGITGDLEQARDVVQDTFLKLCTTERGRVGNHLAPWLYTVCRNRALDVRQKERRMIALHEGQAEALASADPDPGVCAEQRETQAKVSAALATLPERQQEVVRLKFQEGLSYRAISEITGLSASNVGFLIHAAIKTIRQRLQNGPEPARES